MDSSAQVLKVGKPVAAAGLPGLSFALSRSFRHAAHHLGKYQDRAGSPDHPQNIHVCPRRVCAPGPAPPMTQAVTVELQIRRSNAHKAVSPRGRRAVPAQWHRTRRSPLPDGPARPFSHPELSILFVGSPCRAGRGPWRAEPAVLPPLTSHRRIHRRRLSARTVTRFGPFSTRTKSDGVSCPSAYTMGLGARPGPAYETASTTPTVETARSVLSNAAAQLVADRLDPVDGWPEA